MAVDRALYPELFEAGGLAAALSRCLEKAGSQLLVHTMGPQSVPFASVKSTDRSSQVTLAAHERKFSVDFWCQGCKYGHGWSDALADVARSIILFHERAGTIENLEAKFPWFDVSEDGKAHQEGPEAYLLCIWQLLEEWLVEDEPDGSLMKALVPLIRLARADPELEELLPFTSEHRLCFSRTTGYPFTDDCPMVEPNDDGQSYRVIGRDGEDDLLGDGLSAEEAIELLVENLPPGCGPAMHGTADDIE